MTHDLVVAGGHVLCPATGVDAVADVAIDDGRIAAVGDGLAGRERVDAAGLLVVPGLIDLHVHVYDGVSHYGIDADTLPAAARHDDRRRRGIGRRADVPRPAPHGHRAGADAHLRLPPHRRRGHDLGARRRARGPPLGLGRAVRARGRGQPRRHRRRQAARGLPDGRPRPATGGRARPRGRGRARAAADGARDRHGHAAARAARPACGPATSSRTASTATTGGLLDERRPRLARGLRGARARHPLRRRPRRRLVHLARRARRARPGLPARHDLERHPRPQPRRAGARPAAHALEAAAPRHAAARRDRRRDRRASARTSRTSRRPASARSRPGAPGDLSLLELPARPLRAHRRRAPPLGGVTEHAERAPGGAAASCARAPSSPATSRRDGLRIAGGRVVARGGVLDGADVLVEDGRVVAVGETRRGRARAGRARVLRAAGRRRSARARVRGPRRGARGRAALGHDRGRGLRASRARRARRGRLRALGRARRRRGLPHRAARDRVRARHRSTRPRSRRSPPGRARHQAVPRLPRARHGRRRRGPPARAPVGPRRTASCRACTARTPARSRCCASGCAPPATSASTPTPARARRSSRRRGSAARSTSRGWPTRPSTSSTSRRPAAWRRSAGRAPRASTSPARPARSTCCSTSASTPGRRAAMGVISPPLRSRAHVEAVWEGVLDGTLSAIGSDHAHRGSRPAVAVRRDRLGRARAWRRACR